ncbi:hypothetical protein FIBSPDRAFT_944783 [Athelia psychrophila]|uniref:Uncharacterized protein n=1 Tax=Athelia psychrophila TaxID=1759441 RepID=A0A166UI58_9AGAM|nr:hypothetical protein FIBSPDRAFT_944783 [Fibularhizoctonia sp. CBS 109695]
MPSSAHPLQSQHPRYSQHTHELFTGLARPPSQPRRVSSAQRLVGINVEST